MLLCVLTSSITMRTNTSQFMNLNRDTSLVTGTWLVQNRSRPGFTRCSSIAMSSTVFRNWLRMAGRGEVWTTLLWLDTCANWKADRLYFHLLNGHRSHRCDFSGNFRTRRWSLRFLNLSRYVLWTVRFWR